MSSGEKLLRFLTGIPLLLVFLLGLVMVATTCDEYDPGEPSTGHDELGYFRWDCDTGEKVRIHRDPATEQWLITETGAPVETGCWQ